jgi:ethanolamine utilization protein EutN
MIVGTVVGSLWATRKHAKLNGLTFLIVETSMSGKEGQSRRFVAADHVGAGIGETVLVTQGGSAARISTDGQQAPIDAIIVGIVDSISLPANAAGKEEM